MTRWTLALLAFGWTSVSTGAHAAPINAVIGDASWIASHGRGPGSAGETERIRTHLLYVARLLRSRDLSRLSQEQRLRRTRAIDQLVEYAHAGVFPRRAVDDGYGARRPRFIDDRGVHCAVGELVRRSGHAELARAIHRRWEYAYVVDIDAPALGAWAEAHGFSRRELAMIQPAYGTADVGELRARIEAHKDDLTLVCARHGAIPRSIELELRVRYDQSVQAAAVGESMGDAFAGCFADEVESLPLDGDPMSGPVQSLRTRIAIPPPAMLLAHRFDQLDLAPSQTLCIAPGPALSRALFRIRVDGAGLRVDARTEPRNDDVARCLRNYVEDRLRGFPLRQRFEVRVERTFGPIPFAVVPFEPHAAAAQQQLERVVRQRAGPGIEWVRLFETEPERINALAIARGAVIVVSGTVSRERLALVARAPTGELLVRGEVPYPRAPRDRDLAAFFDRALAARAEASRAPETRAPERAERRRMREPSSGPTHPAIDGLARLSPVIGLGVGARDATVAIDENRPQGASVDAYAELRIAIDWRPFANYWARGLYVSGFFAHSLDLRSRVLPCVGECFLSGNFARFAIGAGYLDTLDENVELGAGLSVGYDGFHLASSRAFPSAEYVYLRPAVRGRVRLLNETLVFDTELAYRGVVEMGAIAKTFGQAGSAHGLDLAFSVGGNFAMRFDLGFTWAVRFDFVRYFLFLSGPSTGPPADTGSDASFGASFLVGWSIR